MKSNPPKIENAVIPYIPESRRFIRTAFKKERPVTHLTRYTVTRLFVPHW